MHGNGGPAALDPSRADTTPSLRGAEGDEAIPSHRHRATRIIVPLTDALREHWRTAAWLALAAAAAIATLSPVLSLSRNDASVLHPDPIRAADLGLRWTSGVQSPAALQSGAIAQLLALLLVIAAAACAVAVVTALTIQWTRSGARHVDTAVRRAVGASRRDLALSFLGEGLVIALTAVPLGLAAGYSALRVALHSWPDTLGPWSYTPALVAVPAAMALLLGALLPLRHARKRLVNLPANPLSLFPSIVQVGASLAILLAATLVSKQATLLMGPGNVAADGTVYQLTDHDSDAGARSARYVDMLRDLAATEGVEGASLTSPGALVGLGTVDWVETDCGQCFVGGIFLKWHGERAAHSVVSPDSFRVMGIPLVAGRNFTLDDGWTAPRVAIVNRHMAALHFERGDPLGRTIFMGTERLPYTVVGVVDDGAAQGRSGGTQPRFAVYLSTLQHPIAAADLVVRGSDAAVARAQATLATLTGIEHSAGMRESAVRRAFTLPMLWFARWFRVEALGALLLGALGAMISVSIWASALVPELAIHRALGATRRPILVMVLGRTVLIVVAGIFVALTAVGPSLRAVLSGILGDLPLLPVGELLMPAVLLSLAAMLGAVRPLRRAVRTEPAVLLAE